MGRGVNAVFRIGLFLNGACVRVRGSLGHIPLHAVLPGQGGSGGQVWSGVTCVGRCHRPWCVLREQRKGGGVFEPPWPDTPERAPLTGRP